MITVAIPVGPERHHCVYLDEALESLRHQSVPPERVLFVDDMHDIDIDRVSKPGDPYEVRIVRNVWRLGVAASFNVGVASATTEYVLMMGADDLLHPDAIKLAQREITAAGRYRALGTYFYFGVRKFGNEEGDQTLPCHASVVSRKLWNMTGGFAPETGVGAPDASLISTIMSHPEAGRLMPIANAQPLYYARMHVNQDTAQRGGLHTAKIQVRNWIDENWRPPKWGRML